MNTSQKDNDAVWKLVAALGLLSASMYGQKLAAGAPPMPASAGASRAVSAASAPPCKRMLSADAQQSVDRLAAQTDEALGRLDFGQARARAADILSLRAQAQGQNHWQTGDARRLVELIDRLSTLSATDCQRLLEAGNHYRNGEQLLRSRRFAEAQDKFEQAEEIRQELLPPGHPDIDRCHWQCGAALMWQAKYTDAESNLRSARQALVKTLGEEHPDTAACVSDLGYCLRRAKQEDEADKLYQHHFQLCSRLYGETHIHTAMTCLTLAYGLNRPNHYPEAEQWFRKALVLYAGLQPVPSDLEAQLALRHAELGENLQSQGKHEEARREFLLSLEMSQRVHGESHPDTIAAVRRLAFNHRYFGDADQAVPLFQRALTARQAQATAEDLVLAQCHADLAEALTRQGQTAAALPHWQEALALRERLLGQASAVTAESAHRLAKALHDLGRYREAHRYFQQSAAAYATSGGATPLLLNDFGHNFEAQSDFATAQKYFTESWDAARRQFGETHSMALTSMKALYLNLRRQRKFAEAEKLVGEMVDTLHRSKTADDMDRASVLGLLAGTYMQQGSFEEALPLTEKSLAFWQKLRGNADTITRAERYNLADSLMGLGRYTEAAAQYQYQLQADLAAHGPQNVAVAMDAGMLSGAFLLLGQYGRAEQFAREQLAALEVVSPSDLQTRINALRTLSTAMLRQGRLAEADSTIAHALPLAEEQMLQSEKNADSAGIRLQLADMYTWRGDLGRAEELTREAIELYRAEFPQGDRSTAMLEARLAQLLVRQERYLEAQPHWEASIAFARQKLGTTNPATIERLSELGLVQYALGEYDEAERTWSEVARTYPVLCKNLVRHCRGRGQRSPNGWQQGFFRGKRWSACLSAAVRASIPTSMRSCGAAIIAEGQPQASISAEPPFKLPVDDNASASRLTARGT